MPNQRGTLACIFLVSRLGMFIAAGGEEVEAEIYTLASQFSSGILGQDVPLCAFNSTHQSHRPCTRFLTQSLYQVQGKEEDNSKRPSIETRGDFQESDILEVETPIAKTTLDTHSACEDPLSQCSLPRLLVATCDSNRRKGGNRSRNIRGIFASKTPPRPVHHVHLIPRPPLYHLYHLVLIVTAAHWEADKGIVVDRIAKSGTDDSLGLIAASERLRIYTDIDTSVLPSFTGPWWPASTPPSPEPGRQEETTNTLSCPTLLFGDKHSITRKRS